MTALAVSAAQSVGTAAVVPQPAARVVAAAAGAASPRRRSMFYVPTQGSSTASTGPCPRTRRLWRGWGQRLRLPPGAGAAASGGSAYRCGAWAVVVVRVRRGPRAVVYWASARAVGFGVGGFGGVSRGDSGGSAAVVGAGGGRGGEGAVYLFPAPSHILTVRARRARPSPPPAHARSRRPARGREQRLRPHLPSGSGARGQRRI